MSEFNTDIHPENNNDLMVFSITSLYSAGFESTQDKKHIRASAPFPLHITEQLLHV